MKKDDTVKITGGIWFGFCLFAMLPFAGCHYGAIYPVVGIACWGIFVGTVMAAIAKAREDDE